MSPAQTITGLHAKGLIGPMEVERLPDMTGHCPDLAPDHLRFHFCPHWSAPLDPTTRDEVNHVARPTCPSCGWIYYPPNYDPHQVAQGLADGAE